jgi:HAD superfamily hydrolase (TIGR01509 family)
MLTAVIFDFDGVIVNTEPLHYRAMQEVLGPVGLGYEWKDYLSLYIGFDDRDAIRERHKREGRALSDGELADLVLRKADAFERLVVEEGASPFPGVVTFIRALSGNVPIGLCSGALRRDVDPILEQLSIVRCFNAVVTADDVKSSKPDPECYRLTVQKLSGFVPGRHLRSSETIAIEDTPAGIKAAKSAGLKVLALPNSYDHAQLPGADLYLDTLSGLTLEALRRRVP